MKLTAVFEPAKEGGYTCFVEEFPAAISQGETIEEAKANLADALKPALQSILPVHSTWPVSTTS
jgi:predicted RNase H-like HicB family nuclease